MQIAKRKASIITIVLIIAFMFITGFTPSVVRAGIMGCIMLGARIFYEKQDFWTSIALSLLIILLENPFSIINIGLQLSYAGTIGIIIFSKSFSEKLKIKKQNKIIKYILEALIVCFSAQILVFPLMIYNFNTVSPYFLIANLIATPVLAVIMTWGIITLIISCIYINLGSVLAIFLNFLLEILIYTSEIVSKLPLSDMVIITPYLISIIIYYILIFFYKYIPYKKIIKNSKEILIIIFIVILIFSVHNIIPKDLKIHFIDVGQGDSTLIITPSNKKILIDGGGSESKDGYDVGENILLPYLLDRRINYIDYIIISHADSDHIAGLFPVLEKIKVKNVILSKQGENSENIEILKNILKNKKINVQIVKAGDKIAVGKDICIDILWPQEEQIKENILNNNSIVLKLIYKKFSCLFTGDIEQIAEEKILSMYKNTTKLKSSILKIPHHGSKTSTSENFLREVKPKISLIGVKKDNKFGHPNKIIIKRLKKYNVKIYRTDNMGEITIHINDNRKYKNKYTN